MSTSARILALLVPAVLVVGGTSACDGSSASGGTADPGAGSPSSEPPVEDLDGTDGTASFLDPVGDTGRSAYDLEDPSVADLVEARIVVGEDDVVISGRTASPSSDTTRRSASLYSELKGGHGVTVEVAQRPGRPVRASMTVGGELLEYFYPRCVGRVSGDFGADGTWEIVVPVDCLLRTRPSGLLRDVRISTYVAERGDASSDSTVDLPKLRIGDPEPRQPASPSPSVIPTTIPSGIPSGTPTG